MKKCDMELKFVCDSDCVRAVLQDIIGAADEHYSIDINVRKIEEDKDGKLENDRS